MSWLTVCGRAAIAFAATNIDDVFVLTFQNKGPSAASVLTVAAVTFANGGDNIGIYAPRSRFESNDPARS